MGILLNTRDIKPSVKLIRIRPDGSVLSRITRKIPNVQKKRVGVLPNASVLGGQERLGVAIKSNATFPCGAPLLGRQTPIILE